MESSGYRSFVKAIGPRRSLGQNFLVSRDVAVMEAAYAKGMNVIELGPGLGILTNELCSTAKRVISIEKDLRLFNILKDEITSKNLTLINSDFFDVDYKKLGKIDIMVSNIPYSLSSKVIYWIGDSGIPALICVQKEFAEHMLAKHGTRDYSKLSVASSLMFKIHHVKDVSAGNFYPKPNVDSCIIYLVPRSTSVDGETLSTISLIMNHKKKRLRNAIVDSSSAFGITKPHARKISDIVGHSDERPFQIPPEMILEIALRINSLLHQKE